MWDQRIVLLRLNVLSEDAENCTIPWFSNLFPVFFVDLADFQCWVPRGRIRSGLRSRWSSETHTLWTPSWHFQSTSPSVGALTARQRSMASTPSSCRAPRFVIKPVRLLLWHLNHGSSTRVTHGDFFFFAECGKRLKSDDSLWARKERSVSVNSKQAMRHGRHKAALNFSLCISRPDDLFHPSETLLSDSWIRQKNKRMNCDE